MPSAAVTERRSRAVARGPRDPATASDDDDGDCASLPPPAMDPKWKLDRRASGHLFWRRDSAAFPDNASRVKFRYDVQVVEYEDAAAADGQAALLPADEADEDDATASDSEDSSSSSGAEGSRLDRAEQRALRRRRRAKAGSRRRLSDTSTAAASSSVLVCFLCVAVIVVTMSYQWLLVE